MSKVIKLKKGLDIKLKGEAENVVKNIEKCSLYAIKPTDFRSLTPKLVAKVGDQVKAGDVLFINKYRPDIKFTAPVSGTIEAVTRGERRKLLEVVIKTDDQIQYRDFGATDVNKLSRKEIIEKLLDSGTWPMIKQRPYDIIANPEDMPKAIFVSGFDTAPLAPDFDVTLTDEVLALQAGIDCLKVLCGKNVNLNLREGTPSTSVFTKLKNVEVNYFSGPHPAGNVGIQIHHLNPINKGETVWIVNAMDLVIIGRVFTSGKFDARKMIALVGSEVEKPAYYKTIVGAQIGSIIKGKLKNQVHQRIISGNVLSGYKVNEESYLGFYSNLITVIPEGDDYEFFGWATPGFNKFSISKSFPSFLFPNKKYSLNANYHGEERAYVVTGQYEKVLPMDILPVYLIKAILAEDLDKMEQLGMYEIAPEDLALCEFVCTSKTPVQQIVEQGIELMMKELN